VMHLAGLYRSCLVNSTRCSLTGRSYILGRRRHVDSRFNCMPSTLFYLSYRQLVTLAASSGKRDVTVWRPSVRLSVPSFSSLTQRGSPGDSTRRDKLHSLQSPADDEDDLYRNDVTRRVGRCINRRCFCIMVLTVSRFKRNI